MWPIDQLYIELGSESITKARLANDTSFEAPNKCAHNGFFKVTLEFSFSFPGFSFSGLDLVFKSGFQTWDSLHISIWLLTYFSAIADCKPLVFYKAQQSNPGFEVFSQLIIAFLLSNQESGFSNLDFKTQVFNFQFLKSCIFAIENQNIVKSLNVKFVSSSNIIIPVKN